MRGGVREVVTLGEGRGRGENVVGGGKDKGEVRSCGSVNKSPRGGNGEWRGGEWRCMARVVGRMGEGHESLGDTKIC